MTQEEVELVARISNDRKRLDEIREAKAAKLNAKLVGRCYRTRNNYSCPQNESDYWWLYVCVKKVNGSWVEVQKIQRDKDGKVFYSHRETFAASTLTSEYRDYEPITRRQYESAFKKIVRAVKL